MNIEEENTKVKAVEKKKRKREKETRKEVNENIKSVGKTKKNRGKGNNIRTGEVVKDENVTAEGKKIKKKSIKKKIKHAEKNSSLVVKSDGGSLGEQHVTTEKEENEKIKPIGKTKKKRDKGNNVRTGKVVQVVKDENVAAEGKKIKKKSIKKKIKLVHKNSSLVGKSDGGSLGEQHDDGSKDESASENRANVGDLKGKIEAIDGTETRECKSKKSKKRKKEKDTSHESKNVLKKKDVEDDDAYCISSGEDDCSKGMNKWLTEYHRSRPGLKVLQQRIDDFINAHDEKLEQVRKEREAEASKDGWTVVVHHKGRKKTTDSESGITVGSVASAVAEKLGTAKKHKEVNLEFYRFQKRESQRNEILALQNKFEQDKKRIQQLRAARKFKPY